MINFPASNSYSGQGPGGEITAAELCSPAAGVATRNSSDWARNLSAQNIRSLLRKPMIEMVLGQAEGNQTLAATMLGINRNTLRKKMQQLRIK